MENNTSNQHTFSRTSRHPSQETREKIAASLRGRPKSDLVKAKIGASMRSYWADPNNFPDDV